MTTTQLNQNLAQQPTKPSLLIAAALTYAEKGWPVIPLHTPTDGKCSCGSINCNSPGKHPRSAHGLKDATIEAEQITRWWHKWPNANIGIVTGVQSRLCVLDVDGDEGETALIELKKHISLPDTLCALSGRKNENGDRKGRHFYFRMQSSSEIRSSVGRLGKGLDLRAKGAYVVAPPSLHQSGLHYEWLSATVKLADAPSQFSDDEPLVKVSFNSGDRILEGQRNSKLTSLAGSMRRDEVSVPVIESRLLQVNRDCCVPPLPIEEVKHIAKSVGRYPVVSKAGTSRRPDLIRLSDVEVKAVDWLWEPYIPLETITVLSGDPGVGKTFLALAIAAALTCGESIFGERALQAVNVLCLTLENSPAHVLRPRFDAQGGDSKRFFVLRGTVYEDGQTQRQGCISLADTDQLDSAISEAQARLVMIDPLQSFLGARIDLHRSNETRPILDGIIKLAERHQCAVLIVRHLSKATGGRALYRGLGSIDITGAARSELLAAVDPFDPTRRVLAQAKSNLGKIGSSLTYTINENGKLTWCGTSNVGADDLLGEVTSDQLSAVEEACEFLQEILSIGPQPSNDVKRRAVELGISPPLRRAQSRLRIQKRPADFQQSWILELPKIDQHLPELLTVER